MHCFGKLIILWEKRCQKVNLRCKHKKVGAVQRFWITSASGTGAGVPETLSPSTPAALCPTQAASYCWTKDLKELCDFYADLSSVLPRPQGEGGKSGEKKVQEKASLGAHGKKMQAGFLGQAQKIQRMRIVTPYLCWDTNKKTGYVMRALQEWRYEKKWNKELEG